MASKDYNWLSQNGKRIKAAHVIWDLTHPENPIKKGEVIHHKDENKKNDSPSNLIKLTKAKHDELHAIIRQPLKQWQKDNPEKVKELGRRSLEKYRRLNPDKCKKTGTKNITKWRKDNPEGEKQRIAKVIIHSKKYHKDHPEHGKKAGNRLQQWRKENPEKYAEVERRRLTIVRKKCNPETREKMSLSQKKRWEKWRKTNE